MQELGSAGEEIMALLDEVKEAVKKPKDFDDHEHQIEYVESTLVYIQQQLSNLKQKQL